MREEEYVQAMTKGVPRVMTELELLHKRMAAERQMRNPPTKEMAQR